LRQRSAIPFLLFCALSIAPAAADSITHTVVPGDTLSGIAGRFGVSVHSIEARNHLTDSSTLQIGQQVVVPVTVHHTAAPVHSASHRDSVAQHAKHRVPAQVAASFHAANTGDHVAFTPARAVAERAVWAATHVGSVPPALPGGEPFDLAERMLALDSRITATALRYLGVPYMWGGTSFAGVDCSGFVQTVFAKNGIDLPRMADEQYAAGHRIGTHWLMPGDLVFFETYTSGASHVGIYLGGGKFIHASVGRGVTIDALSMDYYAARYIGARRFVQ